MPLLADGAQGGLPIHTLSGLEQRQVTFPELEGELDLAVEGELANAISELPTKVIGDGAHGGGSIGAWPSAKLPRPAGES